jgi:hypothetical protein
MIDDVGGVLVIETLYKKRLREMTRGRKCRGTKNSGGMNSVEEVGFYNWSDRVLDTNV